MVSSIQETAGLAAVDWVPKRRNLDPCAFECGRMGPYRLGPEVRAGPMGPVHLAVARQFETVLEVERVCLAASGSLPDAPGSEGTAPRFLDRLNHCVGLEHPHVGSLLGAGVDDGVPYVLRAHHLGRTLAELDHCGVRPPPEVAAGILYAVAEGVQFLAKAGPTEGACALGGVEPSCVLIGWDGSVRLLGAGFAFLRKEGEDVELDGLSALGSLLEPQLGRLVSDAGSLRDAATRLRRWRREACAHRREWVGAWLRRVDPEGCANLRRFFGLEALN